jgi:hypothetical protein
LKKDFEKRNSTEFVSYKKVKPIDIVEVWDKRFTRKY